MLPDGMTTVKSIASSIPLLNYNIYCNDLYHNQWLISMHAWLYQYRSYYFRYIK